MKVGLLGLGHMGRHHARHLASAGHDAVVVDPSHEFHGSLDGVDAVIVATPTSTHAKVALPLLRRGVPCLVEKPLAATLEDARALAGFPHLSVGLVERYNPAVACVAGADVRFLQSERVGSWTDRGADVDVILDLLVHDLDLFGVLVGFEPVREIRANGLSVRSGHIDLVHARVETESGRVGLFAASRVSRRGARTLRVFAPGAYWSVDLAGRTAVHVEADLASHPVEVSADDALAMEQAAFLGAVRGERPYPTPGREALWSLELALRIREAATS